MKLLYIFFFLILNCQVSLAQKYTIEMYPTDGLSLPYATITNKKLASYLNNQIINPLISSSEKNSSIEIYSWKEVGTNREIVSISILPAGMPGFVVDIDHKRKKAEEIYLIPNKYIKIYAVSKEKGNWIKKTGRYSQPLQWPWYLCIDDTNLRIRLYVSEDNIELIQIFRETVDSYPFLTNEALEPK